MVPPSLLFHCYLLASDITLSLDLGLLLFRKPLYLAACPCMLINIQLAPSLCSNFFFWALGKLLSFMSKHLIFSLFYLNKTVLLLLSFPFSMVGIKITANTIILIFLT